MAQFFKISLFVFLFVGLLHNTSGGKKKNVAKKVLKALGNMPGILGQAFELWETFESLSTIFSPQEEAPTTDDRLDQLNEKIDRLSSDMKAFESRLNNKLEHMDHSNTLENGLAKLFQSIDEVDRYYSRFSDYTNESLTFLEEDMERLVDEVLSNDGIEKQLELMHKAFRSTDGIRKNIPALLMVPSVAQEFMCALHQSPQQYIHTLYQRIMLTEVKGFAMLIYANEYKRIANNVKKTSHKEQIRNSFKNRMSTTFDMVQKSMAVASRQLYRCDSGSASEGDEYVRFGPVFQKYMLFESDAHDIKTGESYGCHGQCDRVKQVKHECKDTGCDPQHCHGIIRDCERKGKSLSYCLANDQYRRYQYLEIDENEYGRNKTCAFDKVSTTGEYVDGWEFWNHCTYCMCTCENTVQSMDKYVSLRPVYSGIHKVITGARIKVINNVFHIRIKQGKLLPNGRIESDMWKKVERFSIHDKNVQKDKDYYEITWHTKKILLDDLDSSSSNYKKNHVLTGLQFQKVHDQIKLVVYLSRFNYTTGVLVQNEKNPKLLTSEIGANERSLISLDDLDVPNNYKNNEMRSQENEYVELTTSDLKKDAGQNVLPFVDIQPIEAFPPVPLSGAGLFLKADDKGESGGYLALKLFTMDTTPYMKNPKISNEKESGNMKNRKKSNKKKRGN